MGVGVAGDVEPVAAAMLAPLGPREQPVDVAARKRRPESFDESLDVGRFGREAENVQTGTARERPPVGLGGWSQTGRLQLLQNKIVDWTARPGLV